MKPSLLLLLLVLPLSKEGLCAVRPFTVDTVLQDLAVTHPNATRVSDALPAGVVAYQEITYVQHTSGELQLDLYRPAGGELLPAVLVVHGGGWLAGDRRMERPFAKQLATRGYVTAPVSYRLGTAGRFPASIHDLKAAVRWLRVHAQEYGIDPTRIGIVGGSAGGTLAALVGATNGNPDYEGDAGSDDASSTVQAVVDIDGTATFLDNALIRASEAKPDNPYLEFLHGPYRSAPKVWASASPLLQVTRKSAPVLFLKSTAIQPILVGREEMCDRLAILGVRSEIIVYPQTPHPFWLVHPWFERAVQDVDRFLRSCFAETK